MSLLLVLAFIDHMLIFLLNLLEATSLIDDWLLLLLSAHSHSLGLIGLGVSAKFHLLELVQALSD